MLTKDKALRYSTLCIYTHNRICGSSTRGVTPQLLRTQFVLCILTLISVGVLCTLYTIIGSRVLDLLFYLCSCRSRERCQHLLYVIPLFNFCFMLDGE